MKRMLLVFSIAWLVALIMTSCADMHSYKCPPEDQECVPDSYFVS